MASFAAIPYYIQWIGIETCNGKSTSCKMAFSEKATPMIGFIPFKEALQAPGRDAGRPHTTFKSEGCEFTGKKYIKAPPYTLHRIIPST
jgi:hypothetical protein